MSKTVALGFRAHSGWSAAVAVTGSLEGPIILDRRRIETADPAIRGSKQPYHAAERLSLTDAETLIRQCRESSALLALRAVNAMVDHLKQGGYRVIAAGIICGSGRPLPDLPAILRSHALLHTAEGEFFRDMLIRASEHCSLAVTKVKEREIPTDLQQRIGGLGKTLGPPWTQDQKLASMAACIAHGRGSVMSH